MTDTQIITFLQSGEETLEDQACRELYRHYYGLIDSLVVKNGLDKSKTKDLFQEAVIALLTMVQRPHFQLTSTIKTLLYSISQNKVRNQLRSLGRTVELQPVHQTIAVENTAENALLDNEKNEILSDLLVDLGIDCHKILQLYYFNKWSMKKIQAAFDDKSDAVTKNRKSRCLKRLRQKVLSSPAYIAILK